MISPAAAASQPSLQAVPSGRQRLLIITDSSERLSKLRASLNIGEVEITGAASPEEMCCACRGWQDLAVVDVSPAHLGGVLKALRRCAGCTKISVLVEASRISDDPSLAGLLPTYRAMPCSGSDLITLAQGYVNPTAVKQRSRGIL